jgi:hypothetical protein
MTVQQCTRVADVEDKGQLSIFHFYESEGFANSRLDRP